MIPKLFVCFQKHNVSTLVGNETRGDCRDVVSNAKTNIFSSFCLICRNKHCILFNITFKFDCIRFFSLSGKKFTTCQTYRVNSYIGSTSIVYNNFSKYLSPPVRFRMNQECPRCVMHPCFMPIYDCECGTDRSGDGRNTCPDGFYKFHGFKSDQGVAPKSCRVSN